MQDRWWREARGVHSPMCLQHDQERLVHRLPFWEFDQLPQDRPRQKGPPSPDDVVPPPAGRLGMGLLGENPCQPLSGWTGARSPEQGKGLPWDTQRHRDRGRGQGTGTEPTGKAGLPAPRAALQLLFWFLQGLSWTRDCISESGD